jgi:hypothetical protein
MKRFHYDLRQNTKISTIPDEASFIMLEKTEEKIELDQTVMRKMAVIVSISLNLEA